MSKPNIDSDIAAKAFKPGANVLEVLATAVVEQEKRDNVIKNHRTRLLTVAWISIALTILGTLTIPVAVVVLIVALFGGVAWSTFGVFAGVAIIGFIVRYVANSFLKELNPYIKRMAQLRREEKTKASEV